MKTWWWMRKMCYRIAACHFQNSDAGPSWTELLLKLIYSGTLSSFIKTWWWMPKMCYRIAASHFQNSDAGLSWTELLLKHILGYTLLIHENVVVDARHVFSDCSVPFSKFGCGTV